MATQRELHTEVTISLNNWPFLLAQLKSEASALCQTFARIKTTGFRDDTISLLLVSAYLGKLPTHKSVYVPDTP
ncbi:MAG: hypothetical protein CMQ16_02040 [Gammaproteobacteria bacterium]|nr:hypothetical protein [Gammaproteobacteria bacterium]